MALFNKIGKKPYLEKILEVTEEKSNPSLTTLLIEKKKGICSCKRSLPYHDLVLWKMNVFT